MGLLMGMMSLGRTVSPFCAGALYQSQIILTEDFSITQADGLFAREERDPACVGTEETDGVLKPCVTAACTSAIVEATGCTPPSYPQEFQPIFSLSPYILSACVSGLAALLVLVVVPLSTDKAHVQEKDAKPATGNNPPSADKAP